MRIVLDDWDDRLGMQVLNHLDPIDHMEAEVVRGTPQCGYGLFAEWRAANGVRLVSLIASEQSAFGPRPFAVLGVSHTGQSGVAEAAMLARDHRLHRRALAQFGARVRSEFPAFCADRGIHRIEARSWSAHPTGGAFLRRMGFQKEADLPGFGPAGDAVFEQYAWVASNSKESSHV